MKRIFKIASAEFQKIFYRPSIFILTSLLIVALILTSTMFNPKKDSYKLNYSASNVQNVFNQFTSSSASQLTINKNYVDNMLEDAKAHVVDDFESIQNTDVLDQFNEHVEGINAFLVGDFKIVILNSSSSVTTIQSVYKQLGILASKCLDFMAGSINGKTINFFLTTNEYDTIYKYVLSLYDSIPINFDDYTRQNFIDRANYLFNNFDFSKVFEITGKLKQIEIDEDVYTELIENYYTKSKISLNTKFDRIQNYLIEHQISNEQIHIDELNELCAQYYSFANSNSIILKNSFLLMRIGNKSDTQLKDLVGYTETSKYQLTEQVTIHKYLLDTNTCDYNYLSSFNFNVSSGAETNAYDFTIYAIQILLVLITIFTIFYSCSTIAGDQANGAMKMIAIRPFSRNKLFAGKFLSCFFFGLLLLFISFIASFIVGVASYGFTATECLVAWNATTIIKISPIVLLLLFFGSCAVNMLFYIALAMLICILFKSNTLSVLLSSLIYVVGIVVSSLAFGPWLAFTPYGHLDLFKFFGNSSSGLMTFNLLPDANFTTSALIIGFCIVIMNIISHFIFKRRDIA